MKKIKIILSILILNICICTCVNATSFNLVSDKEKIEVSAGDTAEFNISLEDIDMNSKGINVVEGYIKYDEEKDTIFMTGPATTVFDGEIDLTGIDD